MNYKKSIEKIVDVLKTKYRPQKIILFGSCAAGKVRQDSDIDMLIVKDTDKSYRERWIEVSKLAFDFKRDIPFEPFIITPHELKNELSRNLFLQEIIKKGKVLYEKS